MTESAELKIQTGVDLQGLTTLALPVTAAQFCAVDSGEQLRRALAYAKQQGLAICLLGGGSNTVFSGDVAGLVIHLQLKGIRCEPQGSVRRVCAAAGENWDSLVRYCLLQGWYGIENLIAIPGSVGAAPIQNIGAYGVELSHCLHSVTGIHLDTLEAQTLGAEACQLGYRDSVFKHGLRDRFVITEVCLDLSTDGQPQLSYPALRQALPAHYPPTPELVAQTVEVIRTSKLPNPQRQPNAGSFFKNPIVSAAQAQALLADYADMPHWPQADGRVKLAAAWLVDQCGWKGRRLGPVGVHPRQAIVLVNYDRGSAEQLLALASAIQADVQQRFGIQLDIEPRIV